MTLRIEPINWNNIKDQVDVDVWNKLVQQFWIDTKIPLSGDLKTWNSMSDEEKEITKKVFVGLTALDTLQGRVGATQMMQDVQTPHEADVLSNIAFMEAFVAGTELLTPNGWVRVEDVTYDTPLAQYWPEDGSIDFAKPVTISSHETETTYKFTGLRGMHQFEVSSGHRVYYKHMKRQGTTSKFDAVDTVINAEDLYKKGTNTRTIEWVVAGSKTSGEQSITDVDRLRIVLNTKGSIDANADFDGFVTFNVNVHSRALRSRFEDLVVRLDIPYTKKTASNFLISVPNDLGITSTSLHGVYDLSELSRNWGLEFMEELAYWSHTSNNKSLRYSSTDKRDTDFLMALSVLSETKCHIRKETDSFTDEAYYLTMNFGKTLSNAERAPKPEKVSGLTTVYGIQVPSTYLVTKIGGSSPIITGNCVHAKSYSSIFSTLISSQEIKDIYQWANNNPYLAEKMNLVLDRYVENDPLSKKIASTLLESFLFYSGFFWPLYLSSRGKLTNTSDIIRLIIADESVHGYYIGYKYQKAVSELPAEEQEKYKEFTYNLLLDLYDNEVKYTRDIYDPIGMTPQVLTFLRYNANKALANLGYEPLFPHTETQVNPAVLSALTPNSGESHDFFSGSGSSYAVGKAEDLNESDWDDIFND